MAPAVVAAPKTTVSVGGEDVLGVIVGTVIEGSIVTPVAAALAPNPAPYPVMVMTSFPEAEMAVAGVTVIVTVFETPLSGVGVKATVTAPRPSTIATTVAAVEAKTTTELVVATAKPALVAL